MKFNQIKERDVFIKTVFSTQGTTKHVSLKIAHNWKSAQLKYNLRLVGTRTSKKAVLYKPEALVVGSR